METKNIFKITNEKALIKILDEKKHLIVSTLIGISTDPNTKKFKPAYIKYAKNFPRILFLCIMMDKYEDGDFDFKHNVKGFPTLMFFYRSQEIMRILGIHERKIVSTLEYLDLLQEKAQEIDIEYQKSLQIVIYKAYMDETIRLRQQQYIRQYWEQQMNAMQKANVPKPLTGSVETKKEIVENDKNKVEEEIEENEKDSDEDSEKKDKPKISEIVPTSSTKTIVEEKPQKKSMENKKELNKVLDQNEHQDISKASQSYYYQQQMPNMTLQQLYMIQAQMQQK